MSQRTRSWRRSWKERALCLLLAAVLLAGMAPILPASAHWADEYLAQLVDWGFARADQVSDPDAAITRAEFAAIINRAYGYTETGPIPFTDVLTTDWFYDDISIAYTAGYMAGTSNATADPNGYLTREMATCILARNMMMKDTPAENLAFTDSRDISDWARGLVKTAVDNYVLSGYPDNSFGPKNLVSKGEMAVLVTRCVGNPINHPGDYSLGDVFDNVTITSPDVTLRDTTVSGDLYVSGGVGLGNVKLENVKVLGRIIVSSVGESQMGDASVVMRNVTADEMLVDNMRDKTVTLRAEGLTEIGKTTVRTNAYLEDNAPSENGLRLIELEGSGTKLDLAGRVKEVVTKAPLSIIQVAKGTVEKLTVDEAARDATVQIDRNTEVKELDLDVRSTVTGDGDVKQMNINAPDITSSVLPERLYIRPGLRASVGGVDMDSAGAEEYSRDPKILSGYPIASDIAPTSFRADFATNKRGTVYWAVSSITDGSISADDLIKPPTYGSYAVQNGRLDVPSAETVVNAQVTKLTTAGSYYLSAVMQDARGVRSPVKVISFTTPDSSKPAFAQGYPKMTLVTDTLAQAAVMPTKSCKLYYAVLPRSAAAPTPAELRSASVVGNLGYGVIDVTKNTESTFVISRKLEELKEYTAYFWLSDADGANSSNVQALQFKTVDSTPPRFSPEPNTPVEGATNVTLTAGLDEVGTIYWVAVPKGTAYPLPNNQSVPLDKDNIMDETGINAISAKLDSEYAKLQVRNGRGGKAGSVRVTKAGTDVTMNVTGLARETGYDLYYVGQDTAGNFTATVGVISINTLDSTAPVVTQRFSRHTGTDDTKDPMANTDINLEFSEHITVGNSRDLLTLYKIAKGVTTDSNLNKDDAMSSLVSLLKSNFKLYRVNSANNSGILVSDREHRNGIPVAGDDWVIDYYNVVVQPSPTDASKLWVTFPTTDNPNTSALNLDSGSRYYFEITGIKDNSGNVTTPAVLRHDQIAAVPNSPHTLPIFETVFAIVNMNSPGVGDDAPVEKGAGDKLARVDASFRLTPESTENSDPNMSYEVVLFSDYTVEFDLYYRLLDAQTAKPVEKGGKPAYEEKNHLPNPDKGPDKNGWYYLGNQQATVTSSTPLDALSVNKDFNGCGSTDFPKLIDMKEGLSYEFAITVTRKDASEKYESWSGQVNFDVYVLAGQSNTLNTVTSLGQKLTPDYIKNTFDVGVSSTTGRSIGQYGSTDHMKFPATFVDRQMPKFTSGPQFTAGDTFVDVSFALDRAATVHYVVVPRWSSGKPGPSVIETTLQPVSADGTDTGDVIVSTNETGEEKMWDLVTSQTAKLSPQLYRVVKDSPPKEYIASGSSSYPSYITGSHKVNIGGSTQTIHIGPPKDTLEPLTGYYIYFVLEGQSSGPSEVYLYNFTTENTSKPKLNLTDNTNGTVGINTQVPAKVDYIVFTQADANRISWLTSSSKGNDGYTGMLKDNLGDLKGKDLPDVYKNFTLLQALATPYNLSTAGSSAGSYRPSEDISYDGYSVFDIYASDRVKQKVGELVRQSLYREVAEVIGTGNRTTKEQAGIENYPYRAIADGLSNVKPNINYILFAVGHHTSSEEIIGDSYAARNPFMNLQMDPPKLIDFSGIARKNTGSDDYTGSITLTFDTSLFWVAQRGDTPQKVCQTGKTTGNPGYLSILDKLSYNNLGTDPQFTIDGGGSTRPTGLFVINFSKLNNGGSLILFSDGEISSERGQTRGSEKLTIKFRDEVKTVGTTKQHTLYFDATLGNEKFLKVEAGHWVEGS